jgi:hypothetical protein
VNPLEGETTIVGCIVLAGELSWLAYRFTREAIREHWFKGTLSLGFTTPDGRLPKPPDAPAEAAEVPLAGPSLRDVVQRTAKDAGAA